MGAIAEWVFHLLVFPGVLFSVTLGLVLVWLERKVTALVQWRKGPPLAQPFWDVVKLFGKETILPADSVPRAFLAMPLVAFAGAGVAASLVWLPLLGLAERPVGDLIVVLYLLAMPSLALILGASASGNPLAAIGASRDVKLLLGYELPFVAALLVAAFQVRDVDGAQVSAGTLSLEGILAFQQQVGSVLARPSGLLAFLAAIICVQAKLGRVPFDVAEAETEIGEGALLEYGGVGLGLFKLAHALQLATLPALLVLVFWGGLTATVWGVLAFAGKVLAIVVVVVLVENTNPRVRIDQALRFFWGPVALVALVALLAARLGY